MLAKFCWELTGPPCDKTCDIEVPKFTFLANQNVILHVNLPILSTSVEIAADSGQVV